MKLPRFSESYLLEKERSSLTLFRQSRKLSPGGQIQLGSRPAVKSVTRVTQPESPGDPATRSFPHAVRIYILFGGSLFVASWSILQYICSKVVDRLDSRLDYSL